jgi:hypothetical protein
MHSLIVDQFERIRQKAGQFIPAPSSAQGSVVDTGPDSPEGVVAANPGSIYVQQLTATSTQIWTKATGTGNTGWI